MYEVGNHENAVLLKNSVPWSMPISLNAHYSSFESISSLEEVQVVLVCPKNSFSQFSLVTIDGRPCLSLHRVDIYIGIGECHLAVFKQSADMVGM